MIGWLSGSVVSQRDDVVVVDVGGVGYEVCVTGGVLGRITGLGDSVKLIVYTDVRENAIVLYGFADTLEREVFLLLRKVKGIGSKVALGIVSWLGAERVLLAIGQADLTELQTVPGVGKKLAERVIVELREQVGELARETVSPLKSRIERITLRSNIASANVAGMPSAQGDVILALERLGFPVERAKDVVSRVVREHAGQDEIENTEDLLRLALANLT